MSRLEHRAKTFASTNNGFDRTTSSFVLAGVKADNPFIVIRPTTPRNDRIETKLFGAAHGFRGPAPRKVTRGVARWAGCRESEYGASFYANKNRIDEKKAKRQPAAEDPGTAAVNKMFKYLQASNQDIVANFERMDADGSGELDTQEFRSALLEMGLGMTDAEMGLVMGEIDIDGGGTISIEEFTARMKQIDSRMGEGGAGTVQEVLDRIFLFINTTKFRVVDMFNKIDVDGNGELDAVEFYMCMKELGLELSQGEVDLVLQVLDSDGGGTIGIDEFMEQMRLIHRRRRKEEKATSKAVNASMSRSTDYEKKREASRYAAGGHPAIDALGAEAKINFSFEPEKPPMQPPAPWERHWRPPTAERYPPSHMAFASSYSDHSMLTYQDPSSGSLRPRALPALDISVNYIRAPPDDPSRLYGKVELNNSALHSTRIQGLRNKRSSIVANGRRSSNSSSVGSERSRSASGFNGNPHERARWNSMGASRESERWRSQSVEAL